MFPNRGRGRGRGNIYQRHFPIMGEWNTPKNYAYGANASSSSNYAKILATNEPDLYIQMEKEEHVIYLEPIDMKNSIPEIKEKYLQKNNLPLQFDKLRYVYEQILRNNSAEINHNYEEGIRTPNGSIQYSKMIIKNILTPHKWGTSCNQCKIISSSHDQKFDQKYNYWDYQKSFYNTFYYQNEKNSHSWFIKIDSEIKTNELAPTWFYIWWEQFGAKLEIMPEKLQRIANEWILTYKMFPGRNEMKKNNVIAMFFILFKIPWIL